MSNPIATQPNINCCHFPAQEGGGEMVQQHVAMQLNHGQVQLGGSANSRMSTSTRNFTNCPVGLEYLVTVDQLLVRQKVELLEAFTGWETNNKYAVLNTSGQQIYFAQEDNDCCTRQCFGKMRPFEMAILDNSQQEVIHISRPFACMSCCYPCCLQTMEVSAPPGNPVGYIQQEWAFCTPKFSIKNQQHETILKIEGPVMTCSCCADVEFQILGPDGTTQVGKICKQWSGMAKEMFTDADNFGISFPIDLSVEAKATLLAATFLIDFMYFEETQKK